MPTTAKSHKAKDSMFAAIYVLGRVAGEVDFERPEQRLAMQRAISPHAGLAGLPTVDNCQAGSSHGLADRYERVFVADVGVD